MSESSVVEVGGPSGSDDKQAFERQYQCLKHDVRQSLSIVMMLAEIAEDQPLEGPALGSSLEYLRHEVDWLIQMVAGHGSPSEPVLVDAGESVAAVWRPLARSRPCAMRLVRESDVWVRADPVSLGRAVRNLVDNAVRAADGDGQVEVRVTGSPDSVAIEVSDSGPGWGLIPPQERLGLVTVRRFANEHGGCLIVGESRLGGAQLRLVLPRALQARIPAQTRTTA